MAPVEAAWIEKVSGKGIDGKAALEELRISPGLTINQMRQYPEKTPLTDTSEPTQHRHPLTSLAGIGGWVSSIVLFSLMA
ncbi:MAG: hypothetical protein CM1200mP18_04350 [Gammaproteobacteria bacterium]|nr:MAG: hypothetical protein CM1200mP18_04350 [Gammaproteobacteria bacterium]